MRCAAPYLHCEGSLTSVHLFDFLKNMLTHTNAVAILNCADAMPSEYSGTAILYKKKYLDSKHGDCIVYTVALIENPGRVCLYLYSKVTK